MTVFGFTRECESGEEGHPPRELFSKAYISQVTKEGNENILTPQALNHSSG